MLFYTKFGTNVVGPLFWNDFSEHLSGHAKKRMNFNRSFGWLLDLAVEDIHLKIILKNSTSRIPQGFDFKCGVDLNSQYVLVIIGITF